MADLPAARAQQTCWDDPALLKQLQLGNEAALTQVYRRLERPLYRFAYAMTGSPAIAEEAVQETFLRLIRQPGGTHAAVAEENRRKAAGVVPRTCEEFRWLDPSVKSHLLRAWLK